MLGKWEWQDRELKHCFAESLGISRSWTCRDCWPDLRSRVHIIAVYPAGEITMGGESTLWPPTLLTHPCTALTPPPHMHSWHTSTIGLFCSPLSAPISIWLALTSHLITLTKGINLFWFFLFWFFPCLLLYSQKCVDKYKEGVNMFGCFDKHM